ncbi:MAG: DUF3180 domain-containing protein [Pseudonocardia sp.]
MTDLSSPTRVRDLLMVGVVVALVANVLVRASYAELPAFPLFAGVTLGALGVAEAIGGTLLRRRIRGAAGTRPVHPLVAARAVVVAKASALAGAIMTGVWAGFLGYVLPRSADISAAAADTASVSVGLVCALVLVGGALWLEYCCRAPSGPEEPEDPDAEPQLPASG